MSLKKGDVSLGSLPCPMGCNPYTAQDRADASFSNKNKFNRSKNSGGINMELNLGIRAHDIEELPLKELVEVISNKGFKSVQLALNKSFKNINTDLGSLSPGLARYIGDAFHKREIQIAVLGCYINMIHPDKQERKKLLERFKEHIRFARDFGCSIVGTETGNVHSIMEYTEDNFNEQAFLEVVHSVRELVKEAEKFGVIIGIEGGINHPIHTPKLMKKLLDTVDSNNLQVIFDPANYLTIDNYLYQEEIFHEAVELFGERMVIMHAKDFVIDNNWIKIVPVGQGLLDYDTLFRLLKQKKPYMNVLLEETKEPFLDASVSYLMEKHKNA